MNFSGLMMKRSCIAEPIGAVSSHASIEKRTRRPSTSVMVALQVTFLPTAVAFTCLVLISMPTVSLSGSSMPSRHLMAVFSINPTMAGVANTSSLPEP